LIDVWSGDNDLFGIVGGGTAGTVDYAPDIVAYSASIAPWQNNAKIGLWKPGSYSVNFYFDWMCPRDGMLSVLTAVAANGSNWWGPRYPDAHAPSEVVQQGSAILTLIRQQFGPAIESELSRQSILTNDQKFQVTQYWDVGMDVIDEHPILTGGQYCLANEPIFIVLTFDVSMELSELVDGNIDFITSERGLNVPGVILYLS
jgi:hypothetical protein